MVRSMTAWITVLILLAGLMAGCGDAANRLPTTVSASFESGSIGKVAKVSDTEWELYIADDNNDSRLPASWRSWWYVRMDNLVQDAPTTITVKNSGWPYYYLPVYSYDRVAWHHFAEDEVTRNQDNEIIFRKRFAHGTVWMARFYPYTFTDLEKYIATLKDS
ncbi:MAG TPA: M14-type cytosolic carboxypeptidase, partial [Geobacteraceae bacterium]|nr:M14-type cytosolic carboxypeptidase [Geobacteraceae bacterium]